MFFHHLQIDLSRWCFTQHIYSKSCLLHVCFEYFIAKGVDRYHLAPFTTLNSKYQLEGSQSCILPYDTYLILFHVITGSAYGSCLLYIVVWLVEYSTPGVQRAQDGPEA